MRYVFGLLTLAMLCCSGCLTAAPMLIRRAVVTDDVVYVKSTNKLYSRYVPVGPMRKGNPRLLEAAGPEGIGHDNGNIVLYKNYKMAKITINGCEIDESLAGADEKLAKDEQREWAGPEFKEGD